ncbi:hypothetical protein KR018_010647, partial [Drosophila ironensis]
AYCEMDLGVAGYNLAEAVCPAVAVSSIGGLHSNRTSINNSTENLSCGSDNFYGEDLILLDDDDVEAEEISLNSDDCVYAYRGDGTVFDLALEATGRGRGTRHHLDLGIGSDNADREGGSLICLDDETEFLEMDFEPDPPSELEFVGKALNQDTLPEANLLLMQRDYSQISRKGAGTANTQARHHYTSPIDEFQEDALHQQSQRLNKKFARISLNLDQIKDGFIGADGHRVNVQGDNLINERLDSTGIDKSGESAQSHSLPSTLCTNVNFGRSTSVPNHHLEPKMTGAKPKRLSHSSSVMSKSSSSKSRRSDLSCRFDDRCYSCTDFRASFSSSCQQRKSPATPMLVAPATEESLTSSTSLAHFELVNNEENCLDCLEKEFLANTIGKALDLSTCAKCRRRAGVRGSSLSLYSRLDQLQCRSGSANHFEEAGGLFAGWHSTTTAGSHLLPSLGSTCNQRFNSCDNSFGDTQLFKQRIKNDSVFARLSTGTICDREHLMQTLERLHVSYDQKLVHAYFDRLNTRPCLNSPNIKQLILLSSKRQGNYRKLKRLIELVTQHQLMVQFKLANEDKIALVPVKIGDVLDAWSRHRDLSMLRHLDVRFHRVNVIGKIGHIVRQASAATTSVQAASSSSFSRNVLPEFLMIPQYYRSGELTLTRKC